MYVAIAKLPIVHKILNYDMVHSGQLIWRLCMGRFPLLSVSPILVGGCYTTNHCVLFIGPCQARDTDSPGLHIKEDLIASQLSHQQLCRVEQVL